MDPAMMAMLLNKGSGAMEGLGSIFGGLFGNSAGPYKDAAKEFQKYMQMAQGSQSPFFGAGLGGLQNYQNWLGGMQDPSQFINKLMGGYQESPYAKNLQNQAMLAGQNMGSASGLTGSTPLMQQMQQNAGNIASGDQQNWLKNVLGVNSEYGQGQNALMQGGQHAADMFSQLFQNQGQGMAGLKYGEGAGKNQDFMSILGGLFKLLGGGGGGDSGGSGGFPGPRPT